MRPKLLTVLLLLLAISMFGRPQLHDLNIQVVLMKNGDALITERRQMTIDRLYRIGKHGSERDKRPERY